MDWLYLIIILSSIFIGILIKLYVQEMEKLYIIYSILFLVSINVFLLIKFELSQSNWDFTHYILFFLLPIFISFISACIFNPIPKRLR